MPKYYPLLALLSVVTAMLSGPSLALDLEATVRQALENNNRVEARRHQSTAAAHRMDAARSGYLPQVDLEIGATATDNPGRAFRTKINQGAATPQDFGTDVVNDPDTTTDIRSALAVRQPLYRGGATRAEVAQARSGRERASKALQGTRLEVALSATKAFLKVQLGQARVQVTREALKAARSHLRMAENRFEAGSALRSDMLQARTRVSELEERLLARKNALALAESSLNERLGRALDTPLNLEGELQDRLPEKSPSLEALTEQALAQRPEIARQRASLEEARAQVDAASAELLPQLNLEARLEDHRDEVADQSWLVGLQMRWRLFGSGRWASRDAATAEQFAAGARLTDTMRKSRLAVKEAKLNLVNARRRLETVRHAVDSARESLRTNANRYEQGATTITEVLDAEADRRQARLRRLAAIYDLRLSHAQLQRAVGRVPVLERLQAKAD
ncbi:TolC family protein [Thiohalorhabdus sp.]|uniref:TolC family protein n=1 Tax=Thiohalorhabdus sp. TaxID=3094134 RepID=UPI002FC36419